MTQEQPQPVVIYDVKELQIDKEAIIELCQQFGISFANLARLTLFFDAHNHIVIRGVTWLHFICKVRYFYRQDLRNAPGDVIRVSYTMRGQCLTMQRMNQTLVHELTHAAQIERRDPRLFLGHIVVFGLMIIGGFLANIITSQQNFHDLARILWVLFGIMVGLQIGYILAPHERHARKMALRYNAQIIKHIRN